MNEISVWITLVLALDSILSVIMRSRLCRNSVVFNSAAIFRCLTTVSFIGILMSLFHVEHIPISLSAYHGLIIFFNTLYILKVDDILDDVVLFFIGLMVDKR